MVGPEQRAPDWVEDHHPPENDVSQPVVNAGLRVLIVDNEVRFVEMLKGLLEIDGHGVICAFEPAAAISIADQEHLDVAIVDLSMPQMNGWQLAEELRRRQPDLGIILCTGWGREIADAASERNRVDVVLAKPFRLTDLREALQETYQRVTCRHNGLNGHAGSSATNDR